MGMNGKEKTKFEPRIKLNHKIYIAVSEKIVPLYAIAIVLNKLVLKIRDL